MLQKQPRSVRSEVQVVVVIHFRRSPGFNDAATRTAPCEADRWQSSVVLLLHDGCHSSLGECLLRTPAAQVKALRCSLTWSNFRIFRKRGPTAHARKCPMRRLPSINTLSVSFSRSQWHVCQCRGLPVWQAQALEPLGCCVHS